MSQSTIAKRYAQALFELAAQQNTVAEVSSDLKELVKVIKTDAEFVLLLKAPKISATRKKELVAELLSGAQPAIINMISVLIDKKRIDEATNVAEAFQFLAAEAQGAADAKVFSTRALTDTERAEISAAFGKLVNKEKLNITNEIDPSLIGGVRVQIGNYIYDSTVTSKLEGLKRILVG
ncbi:MAG: F0F1 ATP synthase subunit delta [Solibacillus sp.]